MDNLKIAQELIQMAKEDQKMRFDAQDGKTKFDKNIDIRNFKRLKQIISELGGWPTIDLVGEEASYAAWLIAQHADHEPGFQKQCLELMLKEKDKVLKSNIAYLIDRVAVNFGKPQIYGTQFHWDENKKLIPRPIEDIKNIAQWRAEMGLESFELYSQKMRGDYQWPKDHQNPKIGDFFKVS